MVQIQLPKNKTAEAIYAAYQKDAKDWRRSHLGASLIGQPCNRALWYSFRWANNPGHPGRVLRLFESGDMEEERVVRNLRRIGMVVQDMDPATGEQWRVSFGHFSGSCDGAVLGVLEAPKTWHLLEVKTSNARQFASLLRDGVKKAKPQHYAQMQTYMHGLKLTRALYICVCKDTDEIHTERVYYDRKDAEAQVQKAKLITSAPEPLTRISDDPSWFECKFCNHQSICQMDEVEKIERNCRTCASATPLEDGTWQCELFHLGLSLDEQKKGCEKHLFIPKLLPWEPIDADESARRVVYQRKDGVTVVDHGLQLSVSQ